MVVCKSYLKRGVLFEDKRVRGPAALIYLGLGIHLVRTFFGTMADTDLSFFKK